MKLLLPIVLLALLTMTGGCRKEPEQPWRVWFTDPADKVDKAGVDAALCAWLGEARSSLDVAAFELDLPCVAETLIQAHHKGLSVRLVVDSENPSPELEAIARAGIGVVGDKRGAFMHNKFIVRDQAMLWTGSLNFTRNGVGRNRNNAISLNEAGLARLYQAEFEEMFQDHAFGPRSPRQQLPQLFDLGPMRIEALFAPEDPVRQRLLDLLAQAGKSIHFMAFSFTDDEIGLLMQQKAKAGVAVHGLFESTGAGSKHSEFEQLRKAGLDVRRDGESDVILHHKVIVIDEKIVVTGSYNFSRNADRSNDENVLVLHSPALAQAYLEEFRRLYAIAS